MSETCSSSSHPEPIDTLMHRLLLSPQFDLRPLRTHPDYDFHFSVVSERTHAMLYDDLLARGIPPYRIPYTWRDRAQLLIGWILILDILHPEGKVVGEAASYDHRYARGSTNVHGPGNGIADIAVGFHTKIRQWFTDPLSVFEMEERK